MSIHQTIPKIEKKANIEYSTILYYNSILMEQLRELNPEFLTRDPVFIMLTGIECSGKSTFFERELAPYGYIRVSTDEVFLGLIQNRKIVEMARRRSSSSQEMDQQLNTWTMIAAVEEIEKLIVEGKKVVLDGVNNLPEVIEIVQLF